MTGSGHLDAAHRAPPANRAQRIVGQLLDMVRQRRLGPGDQLPPERELAATLRVSRSSLREALRALAVMGVLEMRQGAGTYVSSLEPEVLVRQLGVALSLSRTAFDQLFAARLAVEPAICALAAERMDQATAAKLDECLRAGVAAASDPVAFARGDLELHNLICAAAGNALLAQFMAAIQALGVASRAQTVLLPGQVERTIFDHQLIVAGLRTRDPEAASAAMRAHLRRLHTEINTEMINTEINTEIAERGPGGRPRTGE